MNSFCKAFVLILFLVPSWLSLASEVPTLPVDIRADYNRLHYHFPETGKYYFYGTLRSATEANLPTFESPSPVTNGDIVLLTDSHLWIARRATSTLNVWSLESGELIANTKLSGCTPTILGVTDDVLYLGCFERSSIKIKRLSYFDEFIRSESAQDLIFDGEFTMGSPVGTSNNLFVFSGGHGSMGGRHLGSVYKLAVDSDGSTKMTFVSDFPWDRVNKPYTQELLFENSPSDRFYTIDKNPGFLPVLTIYDWFFVRRDSKSFDFQSVISLDTVPNSNSIIVNAFAEGWRTIGSRVYALTDSGLRNPVNGEILRRQSKKSMESSWGSGCNSVHVHNGFIFCITYDKQLVEARLHKSVLQPREATFRNMVSAAAGPFKNHSLLRTSFDSEAGIRSYRDYSYIEYSSDSHQLQFRPRVEKAKRLFDPEGTFLGLEIPENQRIIKNDVYFLQWSDSKISAHQLLSGSVLSQPFIVFNFSNVSWETYLRDWENRSTRPRPLPFLKPEVIDTLPASLRTGHKITSEGVGNFDYYDRYLIGPQVIFNHQFQGPGYYCTADITRLEMGEFSEFRVNTPSEKPIDEIYPGLRYSEVGSSSGDPAYYPDGCPFSEYYHTREMSLKEFDNKGRPICTPTNDPFLEEPCNVIGYGKIGRFDFVRESASLENKVFFGNTRISEIIRPGGFPDPIPQ